MYVGFKMMQYCWWVGVDLFLRREFTSQWCVCQIVVCGDPCTINPHLEFLHQFDDLSKDEVDLVASGAPFLEDPNNPDVVRLKKNADIPVAR